MPAVIKRAARERKPLGTFKLFATTAAGMEETLAKELRSIGVSGVTLKKRGVGFEGSLETVYRANLWLRTAHRVLVELREFDAPNREALYAAAREIDWRDHMTANGTLAIDAVSADSELNHTRFISQVIKDAVVDEFRKRFGHRPNVDNKDPDLRLNARLKSNRCTLSLDTSGNRLHRRGYRPSFGIEAPLKETLAAGVLLKSGYDGTVPLLDPMCGSGTLLIEGALIAKNIAPGLLGRDFGFARHPSYEKKLWKSLTSEARALVKRDDDSLVLGSDVSKDALRAVKTSALGAGVDDIIRVRLASFQDLKERDVGMLVTNPPYGERLGEMGELAVLYKELGDTFKKSCKGMSAHVLTSSKFLAGKIGLHSHKRDILWNGPIECRLLHYQMY